MASIIPIIMKTISIIFLLVFILSVVLLIFTFRKLKKVSIPSLILTIFISLVSLTVFSFFVKYRPSILLLIAMGLAGLLIGIVWSKLTRVYVENGKVMSDKGTEFRGSLDREHSFETFCFQIGLNHYLTRPYRQQTNGKAEAFFRILKKEFFNPNSFKDLNEEKEPPGSYLFENNHFRRHGGLNHETPFDKLQKATELLS
jgi:hypothetical protein